MKVKYDEPDVVRRAIAAYYRTAEGQPVLHSESNSKFAKVKKLPYVVVRSSKHVLAVYRVRSDGVLRRMKRWPEELEKC